MGYNEDIQKEKEEEEKKYKPMSQEDIEKYYAEETNSNPDGYGEEYGGEYENSDKEEGYF